MIDEALKTHLFTHDGPDVPGCEHCDVREDLARIHAVWTTGTAAQRALLWGLQDGYGEPGFLPEQGYDWSGIRDSTPAAIRSMTAALAAAPKLKECSVCGESSTRGNWCSDYCFRMEDG